MAEKKKESPLLIKIYLFLYNAIETVGWSFVLYKLLIYTVGLQGNNESLYENVKWPLSVFQNAAVLEILHAATGMVKSNPVITTQQVFSRVMLVCGVLMPTAAAKISYGLPLALIAWSVTEIIRYGYYTLNLINTVPDIVVWLRYTTFIILYPIGVTGELLCLYAAQREVAQTKLWTMELPNSVNFSFHYAYLLMGIMLLYIPLFPPMYMHMFTQRKKVLGTSSKPASKTK